MGCFTTGLSARGRSRVADVWSRRIWFQRPNRCIGKCARKPACSVVMRVALATCRVLPGWEKDDFPFHAALEERGITHDSPIWDDPTVDWSVYDAVLIRTTWDYMEKQAAYVDWAATVGASRPFFNAAEVIRWNTHKSYLRELEEAGVAIAPTEWLFRGSSVDVASLLRERGWRRGFIKPMVGATARETLRFDADEAGIAEAEAHLDRTLAAEDMMVQPYLERVETDGEVSAIFIDGRLSHAVQKIPVAGDYRVQDDFGATDFPIDLTPERLASAERVLRAAERRFAHLGEHPLLYARVDFLFGDAGDLLLTELELVEPSLFFRHGPEAPGLLADALKRRVEAAGG